MANGISVADDGAVRCIQLDRPEKLNTVDAPMLDELSARLTEAAADGSVRAVLLTGAGRAFCSGGDLTGGDTDGAAHAANRVVQTITALAQTGGGRGARRRGRFRLPAGPGLRSGGGRAHRVFPIGVQPGRVDARRWRLRAAARTDRAGPRRPHGDHVERVSAATAFEWGMISHLAADDDFETVLEQVVRSVSIGPTVSYAWTKRAPAAATLRQLGLVQATEAEGQLAPVQTAGFREGARAFRERRAPDFTGR